MEENYSKYNPENAPVTPHGGNKAIHDGIRTEESPESATKRDKPRDQK